MSQTAVLEPPVLERTTLKLPTTLIDAYQEQANTAGISLEEVLVDRLENSLFHNASQPLYFNDDQRDRLEHLTGGSRLLDPETALSRIADSQSISITGPGAKPTKIKLTPEHIQRIKSRLFGRQWPEALEEEIVRALETFCAMR